LFYYIIINTFCKYAWIHKILHYYIILEFFRTIFFMNLKKNNIMYTLKEKFTHSNFFRHFIKWLKIMSIFTILYFASFILKFFLKSPTKLFKFWYLTICMCILAPRTQVSTVSLIWIKLTYFLCHFKYSVKFFFIFYTILIKL